MFQLNFRENPIQTQSKSPSKQKWKTNFYNKGRNIAIHTSYVNAYRIKCVFFSPKDRAIMGARGGPSPIQNFL